MKKPEDGKPRKILVQGAKTFILEVPADIKLTFGPWSPPNGKESRFAEKALVGTLRIYRGTATAQNILAMYTGVESFRDLDIIGYSEQHDRPLCNLCKANLTVPGDDLCRSCSGLKDPEERDINVPEDPNYQATYPIPNYGMVKKGR